MSLDPLAGHGDVRICILCFSQGHLIEVQSGQPIAVWGACRLRGVHLTSVVAGHNRPGFSRWGLSAGTIAGYRGGASFSQRVEHLGALQVSLLAGLLRLGDSCEAQLAGARGRSLVPSSDEGVGAGCLGACPFRVTGPSWGYRTVGRASGHGICISMLHTRAMLEVEVIGLKGLQPSG